MCAPGCFGGGSWGGGRLLFDHFDREVGLGRGGEIVALRFNLADRPPESLKLRAIFFAAKVEAYGRGKVGDVPDGPTFAIMFCERVLPVRNS